MVPIEHQMRPLLSGLATTFHRLSSTAFYYVTLSMPPRSFGSALAPGSQIAPSGHTAAKCRHARARACLLLWAPARVSGAREDMEGCRGVRGTMRHRTASPQRLYLAAAMTRALPAAVESAPYIRLRIRECPSLASARAVGGGTPLSLGGFQPPLDDSKGAWTNFEPSRPSPHTIPHRIRACLSEALDPDCMGCMSSR